MKITAQMKRAAAAAWREHWYIWTSEDVCRWFFRRYDVYVDRNWVMKHVRPLKGSRP